MVPHASEMLDVPARSAIVARSHAVNVLRVCFRNLTSTLLGIPVVLLGGGDSGRAM